MARWRLGADPFLLAIQKDTLTRGQNQVLDNLTNLHSCGVSHSNLSLLNMQVMHGSDTVKLFDFGRSVSADSIYAHPDGAYNDDRHVSPRRTPRITQSTLLPPYR